MFRKISDRFINAAGKTQRQLNNGTRVYSKKTERTPIVGQPITTYSGEKSKKKSAKTILQSNLGTKSKELVRKSSSPQKVDISSEKAGKRSIYTEVRKKGTFIH